MEITYFLKLHRSPSSCSPLKSLSSNIVANFLELMLCKRHRKHGTLQSECFYQHIFTNNLKYGYFFSITVHFIGMKRNIDQQQIFEGYNSHKNPASVNKNLFIKAQAYLLMLTKQHEQLIQKNIQKYRNSEDFADLADALAIVKDHHSHNQVPHLRARSINLMKNLLGQAIQHELQNMAMKERIRYTSIRNQLLQLLSLTKQKSPQLQLDCEAICLLHQDILSLILIQSQSYVKFCDSKMPLFFTDDIASLLPIFKKEQIKKVRKYFQKNQSFINCEGISQHIVQLVKLFTVIILKFRIISIAMITPNYKLLDPLSHLLLKDMHSIQRSQRLVINKSNNFGYYLSEISIFMNFAQITSIPSYWKNGMISLLREVAKQPNMNEKKLLFLKTKIKYNLSFENLLQYLNFLEKNGEYNTHRLFMKKQGAEQDYWKFFSALPYIFLMNDSIEDAFQRRGFNKQFDITHGEDADGVMKCTSYIKSLVLISASFRCAMYGAQTLKQLRLEKKIGKIIVIKKYQFTYNEMRSQFTSQSEKDIPITLVLGTVDKDLLFYQLFFTPLQQSTLIASLSLSIRRLKIQYPFVISLQAYHDYNPMSRGSLAALLRLAKEIKTRVYISNVDEKCSFNIMLFAYLYSRMIRKCSLSHQAFIEKFSQDFDNLTNRLLICQRKGTLSSRKVSKEQ